MKTTNKFIIESKNKHKDRYDYSLVNYNGAKSKVKIICKEHGIFEPTPSNHLNGVGCSKCAIDKIRLTKNIFIERSNSSHNYKYDYSLIDYKNNYTKVKIICPKHGIFEQRPKCSLNE